MVFAYVFLGGMVVGLVFGYIVAVRDIKKAIIEGKFKEVVK